MNQDGIKKILAHREPFLLLDEITEMEPGKYAAGKKLVRENEIFLAPDSAGRKILFPECLLIEAMAQLGSSVLLLLPEFQNHISLLAGIEKACFYIPVQVGDEIILKAEHVWRKGKIGQRKCQAYVKGRLAAETVIIYALEPRKPDKF